MERERLPNFQKLMADASDYLSKQLEVYPQFYPFIAAQEALKTIRKIIEGEMKPPDSFAEFDIGLLAAKSIDQIDLENSLILHELSHAILNSFYPQFLQAPPGSGWNLAFQFYSQEGYHTWRIYSHLRGINFNNPVTIHAHRLIHKIEQWRVNLLPQGDYYAEIGTLPTNLGIDPQGTDLNGNVGNKSAFQYQVTKQIEMLKSIAADIIDFWSIPGTPFQTQGTGIQYFKHHNKSFLQEI